MSRRSRYRMKRPPLYKKKASVSYGLFDFFFFAFHRLLRNPAAAIMMLTLFQVMLLPHAEAKKDFDWSEVPDDLDIDMHEVDSSDLNVREVDLGVMDLTDRTQVHEITDFQVKDMTEQYRRQLESARTDKSDCLLPPQNPDSFFQTIDAHGDDDKFIAC